MGSRLQDEIEKFKTSLAIDFKVDGSSVVEKHQWLEKSMLLHDYRCWSDVACQHPLFRKLVIKLLLDQRNQHYWSVDVDDEHCQFDCSLSFVSSAQGELVQLAISCLVIANGLCYFLLLYFAIKTTTNHAVKRYQINSNIAMAISLSTVAAMRVINTKPALFIAYRYCSQYSLL